MHFEILLEEPSAEAALNNVLPKIIPDGHTWRVIVFNGKTDLIDSLKNVLRGYSDWITPEYRIVVLIDRDDEDCLGLKSQLNAIAKEVGLKTKSFSNPFQVLNRIAIEELEAWLLGDPIAVRAAYPRVSRSFEHRGTYRDTDNIRGGTWEALERLLQRSGYYSSGLPKIEVARNISQHMIPERNRSKSFQVFVEGIAACLQ